MKNTKTQKKASKKIEAKKPVKISKNAIDLKDYFQIGSIQYNGAALPLYNMIKPEFRKSIFVLINEDKNIVESKSIKDICTAFEIEKQEFVDNIFSSAVKRIAANTYKLDPLFFSIVYTLGYRIDQSEIEQKTRTPKNQELIDLASANYRKELNKIISWKEDLSSLLLKDGITDKKCKLNCNRDTFTVTLENK